MSKNEFRFRRKKIYMDAIKSNICINNIEIDKFLSIKTLDSTCYLMSQQLHNCEEKKSILYFQDDPYGCHIRCHDVII